jgi:hypothetical protein
MPRSALAGARKIRLHPSPGADTSSSRWFFQPKNPPALAGLVVAPTGSPMPLGFQGAFYPEVVDFVKVSPCGRSQHPPSPRPSPPGEGELSADSREANDFSGRRGPRQRNRAQTRLFYGSNPSGIELAAGCFADWQSANRPFHQPRTTTPINNRRYSRLTICATTPPARAF